MAEVRRTVSKSDLDVQCTYLEWWALEMLKVTEWLGEWVRFLLKNARCKKRHCAIMKLSTRAHYVAEVRRTVTALG